MIVVDSVVTSAVPLDCRRTVRCQHVFGGIAVPDLRDYDGAVDSPITAAAKIELAIADNQDCSMPRKVAAHGEFPSDDEKSVTAAIPIQGQVSFDVIDLWTAYRAKVDVVTDIHCKFALLFDVAAQPARSTHRFAEIAVNVLNRRSITFSNVVIGPRKRIDNDVM